MKNEEKKREEVKKCADIKCVNRIKYK